MIKFANRYTISKIAPDCLSIRYKGYSVDPLVYGDILSEDGKYYYAAERQCDDTKYELKGIFRKRLVKHSYLRDLYFGMVTNCIKTLLRTNMPDKNVNGPADDINTYILILYNDSPESRDINGIIMKKQPNTKMVDLFYDTIDDLDIDPDQAEMIDFGLFNDNQIREFLTTTLGFKSIIWQYKFKATIEYPLNNGKIYNIYTDKRMYDTLQNQREDILFCFIE